MKYLLKPILSIAYHLFVWIVAIFVIVVFNSANVLWNFKLEFHNAGEWVYFDNEFYDRIFN